MMKANNIRFPEELRKKIEVEAQKSGVKFSQMVRFLVVKALEEKTQ